MFDRLVRKLANSALGFSISITQIGGTAVNGVGFVGDTIEVAVDFTIAENEAMTGVFPTLWWDQEGGNVLDIVTIDSSMTRAS